MVHIPHPGADMTMYLPTVLFLLGALLRASDSGYNFSSYLEKMKQILQNELNNIENKHTANQKQLCIVQSFKNELLRNEAEGDLEIMSKALRREGLAKQACVKSNGIPKNDPFAQFSRDSEANFF